MVRVDVCVCTFRRPALADTLASIAAQVCEAEIRVIVADNDETPSAEPLARAVSERLGLALDYRHCPARNISLARNCALDAATADWVAFIDDDEVAAPAWLAALLARAQETGAEVVLGPVDAVFRPEAPEWLRTARLHETRPVFVHGRILTGYTCNVLLKRTAPAVAGERFRLSLGRSGGEDTEFFDRLVRRGASIAYAPDALVTEAVPPERERLQWLLRRRFRFGQSHGALLAAQTASRFRRALHVGLASLKVTYSAAGVAFSCTRAPRRAFWLARAALHAGVVARLLGRGEIQQYGMVDE